MKTAILVALSAFVLNVITAQPAAINWSEKSDFPICTYDGVVFALDDNIYSGLGVGCEVTDPDPQAFYKLEPESNVWVQIADFPGPPRRKASALSVNGKGYVMTGISNGQAVKDVWEYDPLTDAWVQKGDFPGVPRGAGVAEAVDGKIYFGLGLSYQWGYPMDFWEYDPSTDAWTQLAAKPGNVTYDAHSFAIGDSIYVVGGVTSDLLLQDREVWAYSISGDTWTQKEDFPGEIRWYASSFGLGGFGYYGTGYSGNFESFNDLWVYNPETSQWFDMGYLPAAGMIFNGGDGGVATSSAGYFVNGISSGGALESKVFEMVPDSLSTAIQAVPILQLQAVDIRPNPAEDELYIRVEQGGDYAIVDILGRTLHAFSLAENKETQLNVSRWEAGTYFLISGANPALRKKIVLVK